MKIFNYQKIDKEKYLGNKPFSHIEIDNYWNEDLLKECGKDIYQFDKWDGEKNFYGSIKKRHSNKYQIFPESVKKIVNETHCVQFLEWLKSFTGEEVLLNDPYMLGSGIHSITQGGFLKIHADFNWLEKIQLYRKLNILIYLNENWKETWGGFLELWSKDVKKCEKKFSPTFNKTVIFSTDDFSYHGHPEPLNCPSNVWRNSLVFYYYSPIKSKRVYFKRDNTKYKERDIDNFHKDNILKRIYRKIM